MAGKLSAATLSMGVNAGLMVSKLAVAFITGSISLYAESAHSLFDLLASVLSYLGIMKAEEPSDQDHHFGHEKFENLASFLQALLIMGTSFFVIYEAYGKFVMPSGVNEPLLGMLLMLISIPIVYLTSRHLGKVAEKEGSAALEANSAHYITDVLSSVAVLVGLGMVRLGYGVGDPLAAVAVALMMFYISVKLLYGSYVVFMDFSPDKETMARIKGVLAVDKRISRFHKLRARIAGSRILVDVNIHFPQGTHIETAHGIAHQIEKRIIREVPAVKEVTIHIEPD
jgi:cation diffusion facilitator family transporter